MRQVEIKDRDNDERICMAVDIIGCDPKILGDFLSGVANLLKRECNRKKSQSGGDRTPEIHLLL